MWDIYRRDNGDHVATIKCDPYRVEMRQPVNGLRSVLERIGDMEQWNRTPADIDPPDELVLSEGTTVSSSYEGGQSPSKDYLLTQVANTLSDGYVVVNADAVEAASQSDIDQTYDEFHDHVNMTADDLRAWGDHDCSDKASLEPEQVRQRVIDLLETPKDDWGDDEVSEANKVTSFISRMRANEQGEATDDCPSDRDISLLNWGYMPDSVDISL